MKKNCTSKEKGHTLTSLELGIYLNFLNYLTFLKNLKSTSSRFVVQMNEATALRTDLDCGNSQCDLSVCKCRSPQPCSLFIIMKVITPNNCITYKVVRSTSLTNFKVEPTCKLCFNYCIINKAPWFILSTYQISLYNIAPQLPNMNTQVIRCCRYKYCRCRQQYSYYSVLPLIDIALTEAVNGFTVQDNLSTIYKCLCSDSIMRLNYMASSMRRQDESNPELWLWLATRAGKMELNLSHSGLPHCVMQEKFLRKPYIYLFINPLLAKIVRSRWLDIGLILFFCMF